MQALTYAEELRVHAVKVGHEEEADGSRDVKEEQEASREVKEKPTPVYHQQACQLLGQHHPADTGTRGQSQSAGSPSNQSIHISCFSNLSLKEDLPTRGYSNSAPNAAIRMFYTGAFQPLDISGCPFFLPTSLVQWMRKAQSPGMKIN